MNQSKTVMALAAAALVASLSLTAEAAPKADVVAATGAPQGFDYTAPDARPVPPRPGYGYGPVDGIQAVSKCPVYQIDGVLTILNHIHGNIAEGFILQSDLTLTPCYVVKENGVFAHGATMREAFDALQEKLYDDCTEEERLTAFKEHFPDFGKKYPAKELFAWHHVLTGSCKAGRMAFCLDKGIDLEKDTYSVVEFIRLTKDAYGGEMIRKLVAD